MTKHIHFPTPYTSSSQPSLPRRSLNAAGALLCALGMLCALPCFIFSFLACYAFNALAHSLTHEYLLTASFRLGRNEE